MTASLEKWLEKATRHLSEQSSARVRAEIEEHYGSAVASGATDEEAVAALGEPGQANREYRRVLLTEADVRWMAKVKRRADASLLPWYVVMSTSLIFGIDKVYKGAAFEALPLLSTAAVAVLLLASRWIGIHTRLRSYVFRTFKWAAITSVPVAFAVTGRWSPMLFVYLFFVGAAYKDYMLRRKLPAQEWPKELYL